MKTNPGAFGRRIAAALSCATAACEKGSEPHIRRFLSAAVISGARNMRMCGTDPFKVIQSGGNKINPSTADALNQFFGTDLHAREWGRALEELKSYMEMPNFFHHTDIYNNGDIVLTEPLGDLPAGTIVGNLGDYLP